MKQHDDKAVQRAPDGKWTSSGNPRGRPTGSRHKFAESFFSDLAATWAEHGALAVEKTALTEPAKFLAVCASLIPKDVSLTLTARLPGNLEPDEWLIATETFQAIREAIPDAKQRQPGEVMAFVLDAIRAHRAPVIEARTHTENPSDGTDDKPA